MKLPGPSGTWHDRLRAGAFGVAMSISLVGCGGAGSHDGETVNPQQADAERKAAEEAMRGGYTAKNLRPPKVKTKAKPQGRNSYQPPVETPVPEPATKG